jgi:hypothetical protein
MNGHIPINTSFNSFCHYVCVSGRACQYVCGSFQLLFGIIYCGAWLNINKHAIIGSPAPSQSALNQVILRGIDMLLTSCWLTTLTRTMEGFVAAVEKAIASRWWNLFGSPLIDGPIRPSTTWPSSLVTK